MRKGKRAIKKELEKRTVVVMPEVRNPPRRGVGGDRSKEGGKRELMEAIFSKRKRGRNRRNNKPGRGIDEVGKRR